MTTLVAWIGVDQRGPASLYLASDSRLTWSPGKHWDRGRKLFATRTVPHLWGYCGDAFFPTQALGQMVEMVDAGLVLDAQQSLDLSTERFTEVLSSSLATYPELVGDAFTILHGFRDGEGVSATFRMRRVEFKKDTPPRIIEVDVPTQSGIIDCAGSGAVAFRRTLDRWSQSDVGGTSRAVFSALSDAIDHGGDPGTGGPPQLVGLHRRGGGLTFGVVSQGRRFFYGTEVTAGVAPTPSVQWHNDLFEICDPMTGRRKADAQRQPRPRGLE